jgi:hypothetical protein
MSNDIMPTVIVPPTPSLLMGARREPLGFRLPTADVQLVALDDLIARADAHVSVTDDGTAMVDDQIDQDLAPAELEHVRLLVSAHNARPPELRAKPDTTQVAAESGLRTEPQALGEACVANASASTYWWGFRIYMDHCMCNDIALAIGLGSTATGTIFGLLAATEVVTAVGAAWVGLAVGIIVTMAAWIAWADGYCGGVGCNYNQSWTVQGWITTVC